MPTKMKVIAVNNPLNSFWIGRIVEAIDIIKDGQQYYSLEKAGDGIRCIFETEIACFNPEHLQEV